MRPRWRGQVATRLRQPSPDLWRDQLQKMKAGGYNAVGIYVDWASHSPKPGVYDFNGVRDLDRSVAFYEKLGYVVEPRVSMGKRLY